MKFSNVLLVFSTLLSFKGAESYLLQAGRTPHGAPQYNLERNPVSQKMVPTLTHSYENLDHRRRHRKPPQPAPNQRPAAPQGSYYSSVPVNKEIHLENKGSVVDAITSIERSNRLVTNGVYRTYGRGEVVVPYAGASVQVPRTSGSSKAYKASVSTRVFDRPKTTDLHTNGVVLRSRRNCAGCPKNETVFAMKGYAYVVLPQPCSHRWHTRTGPRPGTKMPEGTHHITGTISHHARFCEYSYQVNVRRCPAFQAKDIQVSCTADNAWGSKCNFTCPGNMELIGSPSTECSYDESWTQKEPVCTENRRCLIPVIGNGTKLSCETNSVTETNDNYLPEGAFCRFKHNGVDIAMKCRRGHWKKIQHQKKNRRTGKRRSKKDWPTGDSAASHCNPNPCLNGGTCLSSHKILDSTHICLCKPQTEGPRCEFTPCDSDPCENGGRCLQSQDRSKSCYCLSNTTGPFCENVADLTKFN